METSWLWLQRELENTKGNVSCYFCNQDTGETFSFQENYIHPSASVIKIFLMAYAHQLILEGKLKEDQFISIHPDDLADSAGVLAYLSDVRKLSLRDLLELMIIVSDNSATNVLIRLLGMENVNTYLQDQGFTATRVRRRMMDFEARKQGLENTTSAREAGEILERIYRGQMVSIERDAAMLRTLSHQQDDSLIPFYLEEYINEHQIAHKTGGLDGVVHDAALITGGGHPFILCFMGSQVDVPSYSRKIADWAKRIFLQVQKETEE